MNVDFADISRNSFHFKSWWSSILSLEENSITRYMQYEKALTLLPRSYKLWHHYLTERRKALESIPITSRSVDLFLDLYERSLVYMNKMPQIW
jgi:pre-mRNA-splicing factor SYF1